MLKALWTEDSFHWSYLRKKSFFTRFLAQSTEREKGKKRASVTFNLTHRTPKQAVWKWLGFHATVGGYCVEIIWWTIAIQILSPKHSPSFDTNCTIPCPDRLHSYCMTSYINNSNPWPRMSAYRIDSELVISCTFSMGSFSLNNSTPRQNSREVVGYD